MNKGGMIPFILFGKLNYILSVGMHDLEMYLYTHKH